MRGAALFAGLTLNAVFLQHAANTQWHGANAVTVWLGPLVWGLFLVFAVYYVPAKTGLGPRELLDAQFGPATAWGIWWLLLPLWAVSLYRELTLLFTFAIHEPFRRWEEANRVSVDTQIATYWPWIILTGLAPLQQSARWTGLLVKVSAAILLAAPFAYRDDFRYIHPPACCGEIWWMQDLVLWLAPALLFAGRFRDGKEGVIWPGILGIALPLTAGATAAAFTVLGGFAMYGKRAGGMDGYITSLVASGKPAAVKLILLTFTLLVAGRFCIGLLSERLGQRRHWWIVFPLTAALAWNGHGLPSRIDWQITATPFLALAGALCAGYLRRPSLAFDKTEQRPAAAVWVGSGAFGVVAYHNHYSIPFVTWLIGFALTAIVLRMRGYLNVAVAVPLR